MIRLVNADLERLGVGGRSLTDTGRYVGGGFIELMTAWLDRPSSADARTVADTFERLTRGVLSSVEWALSRCSHPLQALRPLDCSRAAARDRGSRAAHRMILRVAAGPA